MLQPLPNILSLVRIPSFYALLDALPNIPSLVRILSFNALPDTLPNTLSFVRIHSFNALPDALHNILSLDGKGENNRDERKWEKEMAEKEEKIKKRWVGGWVGSNGK